MISPDAVSGMVKDTDAFPSGASHYLRRLWREFTQSRSHRRLEVTLPVFEAELEAMIAAGTAPFPRAWDEQAKKLLCQAKDALRALNAELGWRCLMAADRFLFYGMSSQECQDRAKALLAETADKEKGLSAWRCAAIVDLLRESTSRVLNPVPVESMVKAASLMHEHFENRYHKLAIVRKRLAWLNFMAVIALALWFWHPPIDLFSQPIGTDRADTSTAASSSAGAIQLAPGYAATNNRETTRGAWFGIVLSGILGATISGFTNTIGQRSARIPDELSASAIMIARFFLAAAAAIVVVLFALSGLVNVPKPSYASLLVLGFVVGFSDRLLLSALTNFSK